MLQELDQGGDRGDTFRFDRTVYICILIPTLLSTAGPPAASSGPPPRYATQPFCFPQEKRSSYY